MNSKFFIFSILFMVMVETSCRTLDPDDSLLLHFVEEIETIKTEIEEVNALQLGNLSDASKQLNVIIKDLEIKLSGKVNFTLTDQIQEALKNDLGHYPVKPASDNISKNFKFILKSLQRALTSANLELHRFEALNEYGTKDYLTNLNQNEEQYLESIKKIKAPLDTYYFIKEFYVTKNNTEHEIIDLLSKIEALLMSLRETTETAFKVFLAAKKKGGGEIPIENWFADWKIILKEVLNLGNQDFSLHQNYLQSLYVDAIIINIIYEIANIIDPDIPSTHLEAALNGDKIKN